MLRKNFESRKNERRKVALENLKKQLKVWGGFTPTKEITKDTIKTKIEKNKYDQKILEKRIKVI